MKKFIRKFVVYNIIGLSGASLDFIVFMLLTNSTSIDYRLINVFSVLIGITNNFFWNLKYNFKTNDRYIFRYLSFLSIGLFGLLISSLLLILLVDFLDYSKLIAKIITIAIVALIQFTLNSNISFRGK